MKKTITLSLFILLSFSGFGQDKENAIQYSFNSTFHNVNQTSAGEYIVSRTANGSSFSASTPLLFSVFDSSGNRKVLPPRPSVDYDDMEEIENGYLFVGRRPFDCDYWPFGGGLVKFDHSWNVLWETLTDEFVMSSVTVNSQGDIYAVGWLDDFPPTHVLFKLNSFGETIWTKPFPNIQWNDILNNHQDTLVAVSAQGLVLLDTAGQIISTYNEFIFDKIEISDDGEYFGIAEEKIIKLSASFEPLDTLDLDDSKTININILDKKIAVVSPSLGNSHIWVYDFDFQLITHFDASGEQQLYNGAIATANEIVLVGFEVYGGNPVYKNNASLLKSYDYNGNTFDNELDAGVVDIYLPRDGEVRESIFVTPTMSDTIISYYSFFDSISITIKNYGNSIIDEVKINIRILPDIDGICDFMRTGTKAFNDLNLAPDEETTIYIGGISGGTTDPEGGSKKLCFWTSTPNQKTDGDIENDLWCEDVMVVTDTKEEIASKSIILFPNPVSEKLFFDLKNVKTSNFKIFSSYGQAILSGKINNSNKGINVAALSSGIYFIEIETAKGTLVKRFIKN